jgi:hypothetical protein
MKVNFCEMYTRTHVTFQLFSHLSLGIGCQAMICSPKRNREREREEKVGVE